MKNAIRSYLVFTTGLYRIVTFLLVPILTVVLQWAARPTDFCLVAYLNAVVLLFAEIMLDYWVFGGIAVKNVRQMEYLKTSGKGRSVMRMALIVDMVRQLLVSVFLFAAGGVLFICRQNPVSWENGELAAGVAVLLLEYFLIVTGITVARHFDGLMVNMLIAAAALLLLAGGLFLIAVNVYIMLAVGFVLAAASGMFGVWKVMKRVEEGYYDQAV